MLDRGGESETAIGVAESSPKKEGEGEGLKGLLTGAKGQDPKGMPLNDEPSSAGLPREGWTWDVFSDFARRLLTYDYSVSGR